MLEHSLMIPNIYCSVLFYAILLRNISGCTNIAVDYVIETDHPYANNQDITWILTHECAEKTSIQFEDLNVYITDDIARWYYTGDLGSLWTQWFYGDTLNINFVSNGATTAYGFKTQSYEACVCTGSPTNNPTKWPSVTPTNNPTNNPSNITTNVPTNNPITSLPTYTPTPSPTNNPTNIPTNYPSNIPTNVPTNNPTKAPTEKSTASDQDGQVQNSISTTTRYLITESPQVSFVNTTSFIQIIIITTCLCIILCICLCLREKYKSNKLKKAFSTKTLTEIDLGNVIVMQNDDNIVANIMAKKDEIVLAVSSDNGLNALSSDGGMTTAGFVDKNDEEKEVTFMAMLSVARIQCAQELMVSAIEERYKMELEEEGDNSDDSFDDVVKSKYLGEGKNAFGLRENKTTNDGSTCTTTGSANDVNNQNEK